MAIQLVKSFNALPREQKASGLVPNEWHFDIRYVHLEPTPSHILLLIQPQSQFLHIERLPLGLSTSSSGLAFFPESGKEAAPEVAKGLLHSFVNNLGQNERPGAPPALAPWKLTTEDKDIAAAIGAEFKRLGVRAEGLHKISISTKSLNRTTDEAFESFFETLKKGVGFDDHISSFILTPTSIVFHNFYISSPQPPLRSLDIDTARHEFDMVLQYTQMLANARPPKEADVDARVMATKINEEMQLVNKLVAARPESVIKEEADQGNPEAALDYGLRLFLGLGCKYDRTLSHTYLIKVTLSPQASDELKSTAHSILIGWYISAASGEEIRSRYMFAASHHANLAVSLGRRVSAASAPASPEVLQFMTRVLNPQAHKIPELLLFFKDAWSAWEMRNEQIAGDMEKMEKKRLKSPLRYRCAAVDCGVETDKGKMMSKCAGKCDADKKPHYCSKDCQKADWKNHKPFCKPGAPCSVLDTSMTPTTMEARSSSSQGSLQIPIKQPDGSTILVSSSTIDVKMLKEIRDIATTSDCSLPSSLRVELGKLDDDDDEY